MTRASELKALRQLLTKRREELLQTTTAARRELAALQAQERDPEYEENAQSELADYTLSHLLETQRRELASIDLAIIRLNDDAFGECIDCGMPIPFERLSALPFALRCEEDATAHEREQRGGATYAMPTL